MVQGKKHRKSILIADNSVTIQKLVNLTFAELDYEIYIASDGVDALTKTRSMKPDVVLADCGLDQLDGISVCEGIRKDKTLSKTKIILLKGADDSDLEKRIRAAKPDYILMKPFDSIGLRKAVEDLSDLEEEETTLTIPPEKKLENIATSVLKENVDSEEPTLVPTTTLIEKSVSVAAAPAPSSTESESQIKDWIDKNLPSIAERLIKEEILRQTQSS